MSQQAPKQAPAFSGAWWIPGPHFQTTWGRFGRLGLDAETSVRTQRFHHAVCFHVQFDILA